MAISLPLWLHPLDTTARRHVTPAGVIHVTAANPWAGDARPGQDAAGACMVSTVHAPTQIRSPSWSGTRTPATISPLLTIVPFADPGSSTAQVPSGSAISTACRWETPGSGGGP